MISALATGYLFLGGSGAGALFVLCTMEWLRTCRQRTFGMHLLPRELFSRAWSACLLALGLGVVFLLFDLGHIEAILYLFSTPQPVALTVGAFSLPAAVACAAGFLALSVIDGAGASDAAVRILAVVGSVLGIVVMGYTGILLQDMVSVLAWQSPLVPALFVLSSLSCGVALVLGSAAFVEARVPLAGFLSHMLRADSALIVLEAVALAAFIIICSGDPGRAAAAHAWLSGPLAPAFWVGLVGAGLLLPFIMEQLVTFSSHRHQLLVIAAAVLLGGLMMRFCMVGLAPFDPAYALVSAGFDLNMPIE